VLEWLQAKNITVEVHDLDNDHTPPPIDVFARPALFEDGSLKAYGMDIIDYFEKRSA
jgi:glutaredoxin 2